ncbi:CPBP family intramembrane glutamic endopeptidase [Pseudonocardia sp.]|jgi:membrane protease YdiL (CAAX protease family)|uniref:CPBP family intramembrane glutamic endopeptidase n=1 Tax=Pseudonocardia sp. TaxID=60912 RepID=UPI0031FD177B
MTTYDTATQTVQIPTWSRGTVLKVWAAAALPMGLLAWVVAPLLAHAFLGPTALPRAVILTLTTGLIWQFFLVLIVVRREQGTLRWPVLKAALWLQAPRSPSSGRVGGMLWLVLIPCLLIFGAEEFLPALSPAAGHDLPTFLESAAGTHLLSGNWTWFAAITILVLFNTVLGEELLFRGLLLPRMRGAFGRADWAANGVLFAVYHLHMPWAIPTVLIDTFALAYPSRRYRSALIGIAVHSAQSVLVLSLALSLALR